MKKEIVTSKEEIDDVLGENLGEISNETWEAICSMTKKRIRPSDIGIAIELFELGTAWQKERNAHSEKEMKLMAKTIEALTKQVKEDYSKEEVEGLLSKYGMWRVSNPRIQIDVFFAENLKK